MSAGLLARSTVDDRLRLRIAADAEGLEAGREALATWLGRAGAGPRSLYQAELAYEELITNIIKFAFKGMASSPIDVSAGISAEEIDLVIEDDGAPFDPALESQRRSQRLPAPGDAGGRGLMLVGKAARRVEYERVGARNRVRVGIPR